ncbi:MAG: hypothetical protein H6993_16875 [Pseudomonadales bacterium]|nr:hypothetical protein [Pseudomonadales bacterium]MCP5185642.1 hypothetical protein [Pseudomonadales bacterium]
MKQRHTLFVPFLLLALAAPAIASERNTVSGTVGKTVNYCIGGSEDRKLIPQDEVVQNPFHETTQFSCQSEGGRPTYMPDLEPAIKDGKLA